MDPYRNATRLIYPNSDYSLEPNFPTQVKSYNYEMYTVKEGDTLQNIAYKYYGDSGYWHYIMEMNDIVNPFEEVVIGKLLKIPKLNG